MPPDREKKSIEAIEIEEGLFQKYMEDSDPQITESEWKAYLQKRYAEIKFEYKSYVLQKRECEAQKREDLLNKLTVPFRNNYKARKWVVAELRLAGIPTEDPFVA